MSAQKPASVPVAPVRAELDAMRARPPASVTVAPVCVELDAMSARARVGDGHVCAEVDALSEHGQVSLRWSVVVPERPEVDASEQKQVPLRSVVAAPCARRRWMA